MPTIADICQHSSPQTDPLFEADRSIPAVNLRGSTGVRKRPKWHDEEVKVLPLLLL